MRPSLGDPSFWIGGAVLAALLAGLRWGRGTALGLAGAALLALLPALNLIPHTSYRRVIDSYAYPATSFACLLAGLVLMRGLARLPGRLQGAVVAALVLTLGTLSLAQTQVWSDQTALWVHAAQVEPRAPQVRVYLGNHLGQSGRLGAAQAVLEQARHDFPDDVVITNNLAAVLQAQGDWVGAERLLAPLALSQHVVLHYNRGILALRQGRWREGLELLSGVAQNPDLGEGARAALDAAVVLSRQGARPPIESPAFFLRAWASAVP